MKNYKHEKIDISSILVWKDNPRHEKVNNEKEAIEHLFRSVGSTYMNNLAKDICSQGISPYDLPILVPSEFDNKKYYAYEGNRRIATIKCVINPILVAFDDELYKKYIKLNNEFKDHLETKIFCVVTDHDSAIKEIEKLHLGEQGGIGRKKWGKFEKDMFNATFKGETSMVLNIVNSIKNKSNKNILENIQPTNIERIFSNKRIKEIFKTENYGDLSDNDIDILEKIVEKIVEVQKINGNSLSRIFNTQDSIKKYLEPVIEEIKKSDTCTNFIIRADNVSINQNTKFNLDILNIAVYNNDNIKISVSEKDLEIRYCNPNFVEADSIDTSIVGLWQIVIKYKDSKIRKNIQVNKVFSPKIILKKEFVCIKKQETFNLLENVKEARDSLKNDVKDEVKMISIGEQKAELKNGIFTNSNIEGEYRIKYELSDDNSPNVSKVLNITVTDKKETLKARDSKTKRILSVDSTYNTEINISEIVNRLINQLSQLDVDKYDCVISTSLRALIELTVDEVISKKCLEVDYLQNKRNDDKLLIRTKVVLNNLKNNLSSICNLGISKFNYHTMKNFIDNFEIEKVLASLNLVAHKSNKVVVTKDLLELANKKIAIFLVLVHYYLSI